nr:hypothetical protein [Tanacetum cinerariifolium]
MPIPGNLVTADIQGEPYYQEYLEKVAKRQRYHASEQESDPDSPAPKPTKATKKSKPSAPKAALRPPVTKPASSQQPEPQPTPAKSQGKKHESVVEGIHEKEPRVDDEEADVQRALEESLKSIYDAPRGPLLPVVIREPESGKYQPLPEVQGKGKEKVIDEQVSCDLLTLQTPKKKSLRDQFIFQRRTSTPTGFSCHDESSSLYVELGLMDSEVESDEDVLRIDGGVQGEGQAGPNLDDQDEGQAGLNPDEQDDGKAGPNPGYAAASQPLSSLVVHTGPNLKHMDLEVTDVSTQPHPKQMDEGFTTMAYPKVQENLKLTVEEHMILEEPASSTGTLSSLQHLTKDLSFGDLFFNDKPSEADNEKTTAKTEAESIVSVTIQQDTSSISPMTTLHIGELEHIMANLIQDNNHLEERLDSHGVRLYTLENLDIPQQMSKAVDEIVINAVDWAIQAPLQNRFRDLPEADMKEIIHQRMWDTNFYKTHEDHMILYEALEKSINRPPPPPPPAVPSGNSGSPGASGSSQVPLPPPSTNQEDLQLDDDMALDAQAHSSDDEDIGNAHIPKKNWASALASTYLPPPKDSLLVQTGDMAMFIDWFCKRQGITELKPQDLKGPAFELVKVFHPNVIHLQYQMEECHKLLTDSVDGSIIRHNVSKPLPLGGPPGQVTIQSDFFFNKDLEYLRYDSKEECKYYITAIAVRTHMKILSVVRIEVFSMYGPPEPPTTQRQEDSHYCSQPMDQTLGYPTRVEDFQLRIESYQTQLNLTKPLWDATVFAYKHDYTVIDSPKAVTFHDRYGVQMIMCFNEIQKFSDGTLHQIDEALDYRVKEFKVNRINSGLNTRFWTRKDMDRSKEFMFTIQKRLKTRRIFRNLESFIG